MINEEVILKHIISLGKSATLSDIKNKMDKVDREKIKKGQKSRFRFEIWDKKLSINGISAKEIIKSRNYDIDKAFIIYIDNKLVYFQDHNPSVSGYEKMNKTQATKIAEEFIDKKIEEIVDNIVVETVINEILSQ